MSNYQFFDDAENEFVLPTFIRGVSDDNIFGAFFCPAPAPENFNLNSEIKPK